MVQPANRRLVTEDRLTALTMRVGNLERDTGWRVVTPDGSGVAVDNTGTVRFRRRGERVVIRFQSVKLANPTAALSLLLSSVPIGFRPNLDRFYGLVGEAAGVGPHIALVNQTWHLYIHRPSGHTWPAPTSPILGELTYITDSPYPATLPGTPA